MQTIVFHSYKGGLGRSLALVNLGLELSRHGIKVVLLDLDVDAPSLHQKFEDQGSHIFPYGKPLAGYIDYLKQYYEPFEDKPKKNMIPVTSTAAVDEKARHLDSVAVRLSDNLKFIPAGDPTKNVYWTNLLSPWLNNLLSLTRAEILRTRRTEILHPQDANPLPHGPLRKILDDEKEVMRHLFPGKADYLLIDCRSAREYSSVALCYWADVMVSMFNASDEGIRGAVQTQQFVLSARSDGPRIIPVVSRVPEAVSYESADFQRIQRKFKETWAKLLSQRPFESRGFQEPEDLSILHEYRDLEITERFLLASEHPDDRRVILTHDYIELYWRILKERADLVELFGEFSPQKWKAALGMAQDARLMETVFVRLSGGELINKDKKRNVALRADTLVGFMNSIMEAQLKSFEDKHFDKDEALNWIKTGFREAGHLIGNDFGTEMMQPGRHFEEIPKGPGDRIARWCVFDEECGFGELSSCYIDLDQKGNRSGTVTWKNSFLARKDEGGALPPHVKEFALGYILGVLEKLLSDVAKDVEVEVVGSNLFAFRGVPLAV